jgi:hypothetical protein
MLFFFFYLTLFHIHLYTVTHLFFTLQYTYQEEVGEMKAQLTVLWNRDTFIDRTNGKTFLFTFNSNLVIFSFFNTNLQCFSFDRIVYVQLRFINAIYWEVTLEELIALYVRPEIRSINAFGVERSVLLWILVWKLPHHLVLHRELIGYV